MFTFSEVSPKLTVVVTKCDQFPRHNYVKLICNQPRLLLLARQGTIHTYIFIFLFAFINLCFCLHHCLFYYLYIRLGLRRPPQQITVTSSATLKVTNNNQNNPPNRGATTRDRSKSPAVNRYAIIIFLNFYFVQRLFATFGNLFFPQNQ